MLRKLLVISTSALLVLMTACSSSKMGVVASWVNREQIKPEPYKSIFIIALTGNLEVKRALENDLAAAAEKRGIKTYKSITVFGPFSGKESIPSKQIITKKVAELGVEAIFTVALAHKEVDSTYHEGSSITVGVAGYPTYGYYGSFGGYYDAYSTIYYDPGYFSTDKKFIIESNMYDAKTQKLMISIESKAVNPSDVQKASQEYTATLADEIARLRPMKK